MTRDIITLGASAGGVEALRALVKGLPADLDASVFVVVHIPAHSPSNLPHILSAAGPLQAVTAQDGESIRLNRIYVAPPDRHLILEAGRMVVRRGPKENLFRPSIDALFRSAAYVYGARAIGVVLSGALDDGTSGLWSITRLGGVTVIQDPEDALYPDMPRHVLEHVRVDHIARAAELGPLLARLVREERGPEEPEVDEDERRRLGLEVAVAGHDGGLDKAVIDWGDPAPFVCPECHRAVVRITEGSILRFRCRTGHGFTPTTLLAGASDAIDLTLLEAMRGFEEQASMLDEIARHLRETGQTEKAIELGERAQRARARAQVIGQPPEPPVTY